MVDSLSWVQYSRGSRRSSEKGDTYYYVTLAKCLIISLIRHLGVSQKMLQKIAPRYQGSSGSSVQVSEEARRRITEALDVKGGEIMYQVGDSKA